MGKTLIFGATGNLGGLTAALLHESAADSLRVSTSREAGLSRLAKRFPQAEAVVCDWNDEESAVAALNGVSRLLVVPPDMVTDENVVTPNIINAVRKAGTVEQIVRMLGMPPGFTLERAPQAYVDTRCGAGLHVVAKHHLDASGLPVTYVNVPAWIMFNLALFVASDVKPRRRISMPADTDSERMWVSERDIAAVFARVLSDPVPDHIGRELLLTSPDRHSYADVAALFSEVLGETVPYVDDDQALRASMGDAFDTMRTYLRCERGTYDDVPHDPAITELLGRPQETLRDYITEHQGMFR
ncbi:NmrA family NAD(P)-binding protein [Streptomyces sp. NPDC056242]|uniref:NmrA family NAD(P)-binding protein n=1 Tax=unclassified Streptomyces TaxID=2593676 RepID=UPI0035D8964D